MTMQMTMSSRSDLLGLCATAAGLMTCLAGAAHAQCNGAWVRLDVPGPGIRTGHGMAYDSLRQRVVMFGGVIPGGNPQQQDDTWEWDGAAWHEATPLVRPSRRSNVGMAFDSSRGVTLLFGGTSSSGELNDTWTWNGSNWVHVATGVPSSRHSATLAFDPARAAAVLFGGTAGSGAVPPNTYEWNGSAWALKHPGPNPIGRSAGDSAFDGARERVLMFGGWPNTGVSLADLWEWTGTEWVLLSPPTRPPGRAGHALAFDESAGVLVLMGGIDFGTSPGGRFDDCWLFDGSNWTQFQGATPGLLSDHDMVSDAARGQIVLFGGTRNGGVRSDETWIWSTRPIITEHPVSGPACPDTTVTFTALADGTGPFVYQWQRFDGNTWRNVLDGLTPWGSVVRGSMTPRLEIEDAQGDDSGSYRCLAANACGTNATQPADLTVVTCRPDCDCNTTLDVFDFLCFQNLFAASAPYACDFDTLTGPGVCDIFDFLAFQNAFAAGCP